MNTQIESLDLGVVYFGGRTHIVNMDTWRHAEFFCGARGVRIGKRGSTQKPTCPGCVAEAYRLHIDGV